MLNAFVSAPCLSAHGAVLADATGIQRRFDLPALLAWQRALPAIASASTESVDASDDVLRSVSHVSFDPSCLVLPIRRQDAPLIVTSSHRPISFHSTHSIPAPIPFHVLAISARVLCMKYDRVTSASRTEQLLVPLLCAHVASRRRRARHFQCSVWHVNLDPSS